MPKTMHGGLIFARFALYFYGRLNSFHIYFSKCYRGCDCVLQIMFTVAERAEVTLHLLSFVADSLLVGVNTGYLFCMVE